MGEGVPAPKDCVEFTEKERTLESVPALTPRFDPETEEEGE